MMKRSKKVRDLTNLNLEKGKQNQAKIHLKKNKQLFDLGEQNWCSRLLLGCWWWFKRHEKRLQKRYMRERIQNYCNYPIYYIITFFLYKELTTFCWLPFLHASDFYAVQSVELCCCCMRRRKTYKKCSFLRLKSNQMKGRMKKHTKNIFESLFWDIWNLLKYLGAFIPTWKMWENSRECNEVKWNW